MKKFNLTGVCIPQKHYMVKTNKKLEKIEALIEEGLYFTINRARQYGKTTTISQISKLLKNKYIVIDISFEGLGNESFETIESFSESFITLLTAELEYNKVPKQTISKFNEDKATVDKWEMLSNKITQLINELEKEAILIIDEVDKSSNNQLFLHFLGMLRNKYLLREREKDHTFKSVILAGVYDVKNLKLKLRPGEEQKFNSPWAGREHSSLLATATLNIATDFNVDMSFNPEEISTMLEDYENDYHTGMNIKEISEEIYKYTSGYPFLVSKLCKTIDEDLDREWTTVGVEKAVKKLLGEKNTLFDDLIKNLENYPNLYNLVKDIALTDKKIPFSLTDPVIEHGNILSLFKEEKGLLTFHNMIFAQLIYNHMIVAKIRTSDDESKYTNEKFVKNNKLNIELVLTKFQQLMKAEYRDKDAKFLEREGRLLFLCFLKPIINGEGFYYVESQTRMDNRMDIVVSYGREQFIVELKIWHGENYEQEALEQLGGYLDSMDETKGYLVSFNFNKNKEYTAEWKSYDDKEIYALVV